MLSSRMRHRKSPMGGTGDAWSLLPQRDVHQLRLQSTTGVRLTNARRSFECLVHIPGRPVISGSEDK